MTFSATVASTMEQPPAAAAAAAAKAAAEAAAEDAAKVVAAAPAPAPVAKLDDNFDWTTSCGCGCKHCYLYGQDGVHCGSSGCRETPRVPEWELW